MNRILSQTPQAVYFRTKWYPKNRTKHKAKTRQSKRDFRKKIDDLKNKLIGVIVVVMAVVFLGHVVKWHGEQELIWLGGAIALVTASLTWFVGSKKK